MEHDELQRRGIYLFTYRGTGGVMDRLLYNAIQYLAHKNGWSWLPCREVKFGYVPERLQTTLSLEVIINDMWERELNE